MIPKDEDAGCIPRYSVSFIMPQVCGTGGTNEEGNIPFFPSHFPTRNCLSLVN